MTKKKNIHFGPTGDLKTHNPKIAQLHIRNDASVKSTPQENLLSQENFQHCASEIIKIENNSRKENLATKIAFHICSLGDLTTPSEKTVVNEVESKLEETSQLAPVKDFQAEKTKRSKSFSTDGKT